MQKEKTKKQEGREKRQSRRKRKMRQEGMKGKIVMSPSTFSLTYLFPWFDVAVNIFEY